MPQAHRLTLPSACPRTQAENRYLWNDGRSPESADFFTVNLNDPGIAGSSEEDLLSNIVFALSRTAVRDVVIGGKRIVEDGRHGAQEEIIRGFSGLQKKLWGEQGRE